MDVDVDFTACERSWVVKQLTQAAFNRAAVLRLYEESSASGLRPFRGAAVGVGWHQVVPIGAIA